MANVYYAVNSWL